MKWINLNERLPELEESVLLFDDWQTSDNRSRKDIRIGFLREYTTMKTIKGIAFSCEWGGTEYAFNITHWMPLPEPPKSN